MHSTKNVDRSNIIRYTWDDDFEFGALRNSFSVASNSDIWTLGRKSAQRDSSCFELTS